MLTTKETIIPAVRTGFGPETFNRVRQAYQRGSVETINLMKQQSFEGHAARRSAPYGTVNTACPQPVMPPQSTAPVRMALPALKMPQLRYRILKGQKTALPLPAGCSRLRIGFGWNVSDDRCDIDASAFLLGADGRVPRDEWFVFYGQPESPDRSVALRADGGEERQCITVDLARLDSGIKKIVFVMTINEAIEQRLHFGMITDAWVRIMDDRNGQELLSFRLQEFYNTVTSMTLGELYLHNGQWKFNPVGNGVNKDLAGQCAIYGVQIS